MLFASVFAGLIGVAVLVMLAFSGRFDLWAIVSAVIMAGFIVLLPLFKYAPAIESAEPAVIPGEASAPELSEKEKKAGAKKKTAPVKKKSKRK